MNKFGKILTGAALAAGTVLGTTALTTTAADARVSVGIGIGVPTYGYGPAAGYYDRCVNPRFRAYHPEYCGYYGPNYYGYYDTGYYGPGYYEPYATGFWFTDSFGHRRWHGGSFRGTGFHRGSWHSGGWSGHSGGHWHH